MEEGISQQNANLRSVMENLAQATSNTIEFWQERALKAEKLLEDALREITYLKAQVRLLTAKRFSSSSEKTSHIDQQKLDFVFNEVEATAEPSEPEPELVTVSEHKRKRSNRKNLSLEDLPENVIEYRLSE
ncbi:MAG: transposase, partial [Limnochordia bacterium]|nr:transposase [Limnochordia bacterium]